MVAAPHRSSFCRRGKGRWTLLDYRAAFRKPYHASRVSWDIQRCRTRAAHDVHDRDTHSQFLGDHHGWVWSARRDNAVTNSKITYRDT
jgi:hypothetical protein